jgi:Kef-type K+ transport system membrane component KefB
MKTHPIGLLLAALVVAWPVSGFAAGASNLDTLRPVLILLGVVTLAYLATHVVAEWLQKQFGFVTGVEYMVLGAVVGPGMGLLSTDLTTKFLPAVVLGTGSLGLLTGLQVNLKRMLGFRTATLLPAMTISAVTFLAWALVPLAFLVSGIKFSWVELLPHLLALAAVTMVADQSLIRTLVAFLNARGDGSTYLLRIARIASSLAVVVFGVLFCLNKPMLSFIPLDVGPALAGVVWFAAHLVLGTVLGLIFAAFLLRDYENDKLLAVVMGMVIFTSGLAYYLQLSPVFVNFILGLVLSNINRQSDRVEAMLLSVERPLYIVLFFFAGAYLSADIPWWGYFAFIAVLGLRHGGRVLGGLIVARMRSVPRDYPPMGTALLAPGGLSIAMALDYFEVYHSHDVGRVVYITLVLSILASEVIAYRTTRRWLIDATDVATEYATKKEAA